MDPLTGRVTGYYAAGQDVTDRKRNEAALRESEEKYRQLVEDADSIILRLGPDGSIWYVNEFAERFFGYEPGELLGRDVAGTHRARGRQRGCPDGRGRARDLPRSDRPITLNQNENIRKDGSRVVRHLDQPGDPRRGREPARDPLRRQRHHAVERGRGREPPALRRARGTGPQADRGPGRREPRTRVVHLHGLARPAVAPAGDRRLHLHPDARAPARAARSPRSGTSTRSARTPGGWRG